jgi:uncharacterized protein (DUF4213/DUF364 family)
MQLLEDILDTLPDGRVSDVRIGLHWTAAAIEVEGKIRCGLASTLSTGHDHRKEPDVPQAGGLRLLSGLELAGLSLSDKPVETSLGLAAINALLTPHPEAWHEDNAEEVIARLGAGKKVVLVGHFPFIPSLRERVGELVVLEQDPGPGDLPSEAAPKVIPESEVVAITGMTIANHTLDSLLELCAEGAQVLVLGPTTPLSPCLFDHGIDVISGSFVYAVESVLQTVSEGGNFRQVHRAGVKLVNLYRPGLIGAD